MSFLEYAGLIGPGVYLLSIIMISFKVSEKLHCTGGLLFFWVALNAIKIFMLPSALPSDWAHLFDEKSAEALAGIFIIGLAGFSLSLPNLRRLFIGISILNAGLLIYGAMIGDSRGITSNASMSGCFAVALIPLTESPFFILLGCLAAICSKQSQPIIMLSALIFIWQWRARRFKTCLTIPVMAFITGNFIVKSHAFVSTNGRLEVWRIAFNYFRDNVPWLTGLGTGTFAAVGPALTKSTGYYFIWLHSDWFQMLLEEGIVGLLLALIFHAYTMKALYRKELFPFLILIGIWGISNMPLHYPICALYVMFVFRWAHDSEGILSAQERLQNSDEWQHRFSHLPWIISLRPAFAGRSLRSLFSIRSRYRGRYKSPIHQVSHSKTYH